MRLSSSRKFSRKSAVCAAIPLARYDASTASSFVIFFVNESDKMPVIIRIQASMQQSAVNVMLRKILLRMARLLS